MNRNGYQMIPPDVKITLSAELYITHGRGDIDNFLKLIQDSGNKILWADDNQIIEYKNIRLHRKQKQGKIILCVEPQDCFFF